MEYYADGAGPRVGKHHRQGAPNVLPDDGARACYASPVEAVGGGATRSEEGEFIVGKTEVFEQATARCDYG